MLTDVVGLLAVVRVQLASGHLRAGGSALPLSGFHQLLEQACMATDLIFSTFSPQRALKCFVKKRIFLQYVTSTTFCDPLHL